MIKFPESPKVLTAIVFHVLHVHTHLYTYSHHTSIHAQAPQPSRGQWPPARLDCFLAKPRGSHSSTAVSVSAWPRTGL